jgi:hypothetical protein
MCVIMHNIIIMSEHDALLWADDQAFEHEVSAELGAFSAMHQGIREEIFISNWKNDLVRVAFLGKEKKRSMMCVLIY